MASILILYGSAEGQTIKIAQHVAKGLEQAGHEAHVAPANRVKRLVEYDAVIVGASVHIGQYPKDVLDFIKAHLVELRCLPNAFFSVCLTAAQRDEASQETVQGYIQKLKEDTGWQPDDVASFAGALKFTKYGFFKRQLMKAITKKDGLAVDASRDHEYTDWQEVTAFAEGFARRLAKTAAAVGGRMAEPALPELTR